MNKSESELLNEYNRELDRLVTAKRIGNDLQQKVSQQKMNRILEEAKKQGFA